MAAIKVTVIGLKKWQADMAKNAKRLDAAVERQMKRAAVVVRDQAVENVSSPGERTRANFTIAGGVRARKGGEPQTPNAEDGRLAVFEGRLRNSLNYELVKEGTRSTDAIIGTDVLYAPIHEYGGYAGRGGSAFIPPRPYLIKALEQKREQVYDLLRKALKVLR